MVTRAEALSLISRQDATEIWQQVPQFSAALRSFRTVNMGKKQTRYPVLAALPTASFVTGEDPGDPDARKPVTGPRIVEAIGVTLDAAVFFGTGAPASWPDGLVPQAIAAGNVYAEGTSGVDIAEDINQTIALVEDDGFDATTAYARRRLRAQVRGLRDDNGQPIIQSPTAGSNVPSLYGADLQWVTNGSWDSDEAKLLVGDPNYAILGLRQDITYKFLTEASVTMVVEGTPTLISLAENDLVGLRFKMRVGFQTAEVETRDGGEDAFPFAVLTPAAS
jgi:hypothetical protein